MLKFICLGSGSSGNSYFLFSENYGILIDAGIGIRTLKKHFHTYGLSLKQIKAVLITHDHADHIKAVGSLANEYGLPVYATELVHDGIKRNYCANPKLKAENIHFLEKGQTLKLDRFEITPFDVPHDSTDNVGYSVQYGEVNFCLITDAGHVTEQFGGYIARANYLVLEANHDEDMLMMGPYPAYLKGRISGDYGHLSNIQSGLAISKLVEKGAKQIQLCHLSQTNNTPTTALTSIAATAKNVGIVFDKDVKVRVNSRNSVTRPTFF